MSPEFREIVVNADDEASIFKFKEYYDNVFVKAFPDPNEINTFEEIEELIRRRIIGENYGIIKLYEMNDKVVAGVIYDYYYDTRAVAIEYIAIDPDYRKYGLASKIFNKIVEDYRDKFLIDWIIIEIEDPEKRSDKDDMSYFYFWKKHGFKKVDFEYVQPAIRNKVPVESLILCAKNVHHDVDYINKETIKRFIYEYAEYGVGIEEPYNNKVVNEMIQRLSADNEKDIQLINLNVFEKSRK